MSVLYNIIDLGSIKMILKMCCCAQFTSKEILSFQKQVPIKVLFPYYNLS